MLQDLINKHYDKLTENDLETLQYVLNHIDACSNMSIMELAKACAMSKSSILRMTQKLGFSGYSEFKYSLKNEQLEMKEHQNLFDIQVEEIEMTRKLFKQNQMEPVYQHIHEAETIYGFATGWGQKNAMEELSRNLIACDKKMFIIPAEREFDILLSRIKQNDLVMIISLSGDVTNIMNSVRQLSFRGVPTLSITSFKNNKLAELSTYNVYYESTKLGRYYGFEHRSFIGLFSILDLIYRGYLNFALEKERDDNEDTTE
ncbi:MurR/RpiR family transcriptional regulator [Robertmurraya massiliosenegalensis]|uniref:MurR/RpiR family transcriptional regulator n=1 Tax=Robertmurraya massiliosenegalensis TaxID=1287657 RepID=UPI00031770F8|nr:MurR/RpiR family transcriptional regulator [Robertmurraya massiliosenegalensis]